MKNQQKKSAAKGKAAEKPATPKAEYRAFTMADYRAMENGVEVREGKQHPDYSIDLQSKRDARHDTLYVWKDYNDEVQMQWGETPKAAAKSGGGLTDEEKEARRRKVAANKARRKLAEWCEGNLAGLIAKYFPMGYAVARAFQDAFSIGSSWRVIGSKTGTAEAAWSYLLMPETNNALDPAKWAKSIADEIVAKLTGAMGVSTGEKVYAMFAEAHAVLTKEELSLVVGAEKLESLRKPPAIEWVMDGGDAEAEDDEEV